MRLIEISSFKLFCCKFDSHKMFCCKKFSHKKVLRKAKKFPAQGFPRAGKKKIEGGAWQVAMPRTSSSYEEVGGVATYHAAAQIGPRTYLRPQTGAAFSTLLFFFFAFF